MSRSVSVSEQVQTFTRVHTDQLYHILPQPQFQKFKQGFITDPICILPDTTVEGVMEKKAQLGYSSFPVTGASSIFSLHSLTVQVPLFLRLPPTFFFFSTAKPTVKDCAQTTSLVSRCCRTVFLCSSIIL